MRSLWGAVAVALLFAAQAAADEIDGATVGQSATRGVPYEVGASCDQTTIAAVAERHPEARQLIIMATDDWELTTGTVEVAALHDGVWHCQRGSQTARFGRSGLRPLVQRRSGDGTTPAGVFPLGEVTAWDGERFSMFGNSPDPGVRVAYRDVRPQDCWGATPGSPDYQRLVNRPGCAGPHDEWLPAYGDAYSHAAVIGANLDPVSGDEPGEPPYAAAIFLHRHSYRASGATIPTAGCVSLAADDLVATLRLIDPGLNPHFAIGPTDWLRS